MRPVNEYKIAEKIASANKELFDEELNAESILCNLEAATTEHPEPNNVGKPASLIGGQQSMSVESDGSRRVTFCIELEEYEPDFITDNEDASDAHPEDGEDSVSESDDEIMAHRQQKGMFNNNVLSSAPSELKPNDNNNLPKNQLKDDTRICGYDKTATPMMDSVSGMANDCNGTTVSDEDESCFDEDIDEICEVIEDFALVATSHPETQRMAMNKTDATPLGQNDVARSSSSSRSDSVQSEIMKPSLIITKHSYPNSETKNPAFSSLSQPKLKPHKPAIPRQPSSTSSPSSASNHSGGSQTSSAGSNRICRHNNNQHHAPPSDILKIQLNFKSCCEHKHLDAPRLPRYCGYLSQYGLSKEQLERREARRERHQRRRSKRVERLAQEESQKSRVNDEAFESWLRLKMRTSSRRAGTTQNMYDVVQPPVARGRLGKSLQF